MEQNRESGNRPPKVQYTDLGQRNKDSTIQQTGLSTNVDETKGISTCAKKKKKRKRGKECTHRPYSPHKNQLKMYPTNLNVKYKLKNLKKITDYLDACGLAMTF